MSAQPATAPPVTVPTAARRGAGRVITAWFLAAVGSVVAVVVIATTGKAIGVSHAQQLGVGPLMLLTVFGVAAGTVGWTVVSRWAADPEASLRRLVPAVLVVSYVPDLLLGLGSVSGGAAVTLAVAHTAVFAVTIPVLRRLLPPAAR